MRPNSFLLPLLFLFAAAALHAAPVSFRDGESFHFRVSWGIFSHAAEITIAARAEQSAGLPQIRVATSVVRHDGEAWIELEVADNGPGLPGDFGERWFEPYTTSKPRGTGLGLAVVKKIAEEHGGHVRAGNAPQGGAMFTLRLPLERA